MAAFDDFAFSSTDFSGTARLFPLPNLVLFPHVMQPLHIFEPRYRELLEEALTTDQLVTMAMLAPGWEKDYEGRPPLFPMACLGRVAVHHRVADGAYNVLVVGLKRVRLLRGCRRRRAFARPRPRFVTTAIHRKKRPRPLLSNASSAAAFLEILPHLPQAQDQLDQLLGSEVSLGTLTDIISYMLDIELVQKETLLAEANVHRRTRLLLQHLAAISTDDSPGSGGPWCSRPSSASTEAGRRRPMLILGVAEARTVASPCFCMFVQLVSSRALGDQWF